MSYRWARLTPYGATILEPGYWFFESTYDALTPAVLSQIHSVAPIEQLLEDPSRNWILVRIRVEGGLDRILPAEVTGKLGPIQRLDDPSVTLQQVKESLYGPGLLEPQGFLEWLTARHPEAMASILSGAQQVKEAGDFVSNTLQVAGTLAALAFGLWVAARLTGRK